MSDVRIGVSLGRKNRPTAISVVQVTEQGEFLCDAYHDLAKEFGATLADIISHLEEIAGQEEKQKGVTPEFFVDVTGLGQPIIDELDERSIEVTPVYIVDDEEDVRKTSTALYLLRYELMTRLVLLVQHETLKENERAAALIRTLKEFDPRAADTPSEYKDLAIALGMACWDPMPEPPDPRKTGLPSQRPPPQPSR